MVNLNELVNEHLLVLSESYEYMSNWLGCYEKYADMLKGGDGSPSEKESFKVVESQGDKVGLTNKDAQLKMLLDEFCEKLKRRGSTISETMRLTDAHNTRHDHFSSLQMNIKSKLKFGTNESKFAANNIVTQTIKFRVGSIKTRHDMGASISGYIAILRKSKNASDVALLNIDERIKELEASNKAYIDLEAKRGVVKTEKGRSASVVYRDCYKAFNQLLYLLRATFYFYDNDQFAAFATELNGITESYQLTINKRKADIKRKKESQGIKSSYSDEDDAIM
ncbi:MAG: DUF6261 family protein [Bacteroides sp.]|nr:DUF6261 family protein [Bacteroides sp.]